MINILFYLFTDDDQYVKNRRISKKKFKPSCTDEPNEDEEHNIFEIYDKLCKYTNSNANANSKL